jgi:hypothetical protein
MHALASIEAVSDQLSTCSTDFGASDGNVPISGILCVSTTMTIWLARLREGAAAFWQGATSFAARRRSY